VVSLALLAFSLALNPAAQAASPAPPSEAKPSPSADYGKPELRNHANWPAASAADTESPVAVVHAFFSAISAGPGEKLDPTRLRSLFVPEGRIAVGIPPNKGQAADIVFLTPEDYADGFDLRSPTFGFFDHDLADQVQQFGVMAHVYAAYESRNALADPKPFVRGVKSFDLLHSGDRWYIVQVYWDRERPDNPIPDRYLHDHRE
jgi:hypothetical protein